MFKDQRLQKAAGLSPCVHKYTKPKESYKHSIIDGLFCCEQNKNHFEVILILVSL